LSALRGDGILEEGYHPFTRKVPYRAAQQVPRPLASQVTQGEDFFCLQIAR
jgi:hypothetical protein